MSVNIRTVSKVRAAVYSTDFHLLNFPEALGNPGGTIPSPYTRKCTRAAWEQAVVDAVTCCPDPPAHTAIPSAEDRCFV